MSETALRPRIALIQGRDSSEHPARSSWLDRFECRAVSAEDALASDVDALRGCDACLIDATTLLAGRREEELEALLDVVRSAPLRLRAVVLTDRLDGHLAQRATVANAWDVVAVDQDPEQIAERLLAACRLRALERWDAVAVHERDRETASLPSRMGILGDSQALRSVIDQLQQASPSDVTVLLLGESGTGKGLAARYIHARSARAAAPFVLVDCGSIPDHLLETELFGHARGAFTGARHSRPGRFEEANGGTLFLDEIGELPNSLQGKLLRFLDDHTILRVGENEPRRLDVRVLAATNRDIESEMERGAFRQDLFFRLAVYAIRLPPLRERKEDLPVLGRHLLDLYARTYRRPAPRFSRAALEALEAHDWPGNVRELNNRIRRAVIMMDQREVTPVDLGLESPPVAAPLTLREARRISDIRSIRGVLRRHGHNRESAARELGVSRTRLYELIRRYELQSSAED